MGNTTVKNSPSKLLKEKTIYFLVQTFLGEGHFVAKVYFTFFKQH
jgi:hypothetical protein